VAHNKYVRPPPFPLSKGCTMYVNLSPAEIGAIVTALQLENPPNSDENALALSLCDEVYKHFKETLKDPVAVNDMFEQWCFDFDIIL